MWGFRRITAKWHFNVNGVKMARWISTCIGLRIYLFVIGIDRHFAYLWLLLSTNSIADQFWLAWSHRIFFIIDWILGLGQTVRWMHTVVHDRNGFSTQFSAGFGFWILTFAVLYLSCQILVLECSKKMYFCYDRLDQYHEICLMLAPFEVFKRSLAIIIFDLSLGYLGE